MIEKGGQKKSIKKVPLWHVLNSLAKAGEQQGDDRGAIVPRAGEPAGAQGTHPVMNGPFLESTQSAIHMALRGTRLNKYGQPFSIWKLLLPSANKPSQRGNGARSLTWESALRGEGKNDKKTRFPALRLKKLREYTHSRSLYMFYTHAQSSLSVLSFTEAAHCHLRKHPEDSASWPHSKDAGHQSQNHYIA